jgi:Na+-transporting NADH:ubiquinone oxidoreductase subunit B
MKIADYRIMLSMILGVAFMGIIFNVFAGSFPDNGFIAIPFYFHYIMGSFFFAMAFMATDPVTAASTNRGKWIYGFMIGVIGLIIRIANPAYPEGWMLAIIFMNIFAALIDYYIIQGNIKRRVANV